MSCPRCGQKTAQIPNGLGGTTEYCVACGPSAYPRFVESTSVYVEPQRPGKKVTLIPSASHTSGKATAMPPFLEPIVAEEPDNERQTIAKLGLLREILERIGEWWPEQYGHIASEINSVFKRASYAQLSEFSDLLAERPARHPLELLVGWLVKSKAENMKHKIFKEQSNGTY